MILGQTVTTIEQVRTFTEAVFAPDDLIEIRLIWPSREQANHDKTKSPKSSWVKAENLHRGEHVRRWLEANAQGWGVYVGANPRKASGGRKGDAVACARNLLIDFDGRETMEGARRKVQEADLPEPTMWIASGHGVHAWWRLEEPLTDLLEWTARQKALIAHLAGADASIHDPPRVMRLPGFTNTKASPVPCKLVEANPARVFPLLEFPRGEPAGVPASAIPGLPAHVSKLLASDPKLAARWSGDVAGLNDASRSGIAASIAERLIFARIPRGEVDEALRVWGETTGYEKAAEARWRELTITSAEQFVATNAERRRGETRAGLSAEAHSGSEDRDESDQHAQRDHLVNLALVRYRFGMSLEHDAFAVERLGPNIAIMLGGARDSLKAILSREYRREFKRTPSSAALTDALFNLQGEATDREPEEVHLRAAGYQGSIVIDLGTKDGHAVIVSSTGWSVGPSPVLFRRTNATGPLPLPQAGGNIEALRQLLNITDASWPLVVGWSLAALIPHIPHPILLLGGEQGGGKSTAQRFLMDIFDPSPGGLRSPPLNPEDWAVTASASWGLGFDNISEIPEWWSDALCKAVTGGGWYRRRRYTDSDLSILTFHRVIALSSIDAGALRGDLGDRLLLVDLEAIPDRKRRTEAELRQRFSSLHAVIFGGLLDLLVKVLAEMPSVRLEFMPRMADFAVVLAAMDRVTGTSSLADYMGQRCRVASEVVDDDVVAAAIRKSFHAGDVWEGTAGALLKRVAPVQGELLKSWPKSPTGFARKLHRVSPALRQLGIDIIAPSDKDKKRIYRIEVNSGFSPSDHMHDDEQVNRRVAAFEQSEVGERPAERPTQKRPSYNKNADSGRSGVQGVQSLNSDEEAAGSTS